LFTFDLNRSRKVDRSFLLDPQAKSALGVVIAKPSNPERIRTAVVAEYLSMEFGVRHQR
jgi:hypothetical protein